MTSPSEPRLRIAAIDFLNPAPLMWDFEHAPYSAELSTRYAVQRMLPAECAASLLTGTSDLGLIPVAALTEDLAIVPGCTIASLDRVRSIQLIVRGSRPLEEIETIAADTASRSSLAYANILFRKFLGTSPVFLPHPADATAMLQMSDAALLIGDPALLALEARASIERQVGPCQWFDVAHEWTTRTGLPWVAAVWAARPQTVTSPAQLIHDLNQSRIHGLAHIEDLVTAWTPRLAIPPVTIREYLNRNIYYTLDERCIAAITLFRAYASETGVLPALPALRFL